MKIKTYSILIAAVFLGISLRAEAEKTIYNLTSELSAACLQFTEPEAFSCDSYVNNYERANPIPSNHQGQLKYYAKLIAETAEAVNHNDWYVPRNKWFLTTAINIVPYPEIQAKIPICENNPDSFYYCIITSLQGLAQ